MVEASNGKEAFDLLNRQQGMQDRLHTATEQMAWPCPHGSPGKGMLILIAHLFIDGYPGQIYNDNKQLYQ